ncbi:DegV family protein [Lutibacter sp. B2]|nr:DegV family protein [Lutibacter sp. B2]
MDKIAVITDSSCDLPDEILQKYDIKILPLRIIYENREFRDRIEITAEEVYANLDKEIPKTSLPLPADAMRLFKQLSEEGYTHVVAVLMSSGLSGTYNMVKNVADTFDALKIEVVDSKSLSVGLGFIVLETANEALISNDFSKVLKKANEAVEKTDVFYVINTLDYLRKGGRIGLVEGAVGEILGIKPIISIDDQGKYYAHSKVRGRKKSIKKLYDIVKEKIKDKNYSVAVLHGDAEEEAKNLINPFKEIAAVDETLFGQISPVLGVHTGPGLIGICITEI